MTTQRESNGSRPTDQLGLFEFKPEDPNVAWLEALLAGAGCWLTASEICLSNQGRTHDRDIRALASASPKILSGQRGYKHIQHATAEEVDHAANWLESQAVKMGDRARRLRVEAHKIFG